MTRPWYPVSREFWSHPDWCSRSAHERLAWLYLLSVTRWRAGDGIQRGQARTSMAEIGRVVGKPGARAKDWMDRWVKIGAVTYEVTADDAKRATGIVVTVLGYERWAANAKAYAGEVDGNGVSGDVPNAEACADRAPYAEAYAGANAEAYAEANAGKHDGNGVSGEAPNAEAYAGANATPNAGPYASYIGHDLGHGRGGETRAGARDPNPSLPGLESPEGVDGCIGPSPTSPAATPASHTAAGVGPGAVDRAALGVEVNRVWADEFRRNGKRRNIDPGNHWSGKDATKALDQIKALAIYPLAEREGAMAALAEFRRVAKLHLERDHLQSRGWPLWALAEDWHELASGGAAGRAPKRETPAQRSGHWTEEDVRRATEQSQRTLAIIRENNARRGVR